MLGSDVSSLVTSRGLFVGFLLLQYSVECIVESLSCFIFLCLDLYVLGDDASLIKGSLVWTKHLCILIHIRIKDEVGTVAHV